MSDYYLWLKVAHVFSVVAWMAAILYLPRLFVYHAGVEAGSEASEIFKVMERRLMKGIMTPSMIATWVFGLWMAFDHDLFADGSKWLHIKVTLVVVMSAYHGMAAKWLKDFAHDRNRRTPRFFRMVNEIPALLLLIVLILVILRPI
jgi:protoporphyrinogen IX oxidase